MTRHGRNATASSVYSYHERRKDQRQSGYGTLQERLGRDSIKEFDCCSLTLQPCRDPLVSSQGVLFDKEAILEYIVRNKKENARKLKEWEKQRRRDADEMAELARAERDAQVQKFSQQEATPAHPGTSSKTVESEEAGEIAEEESVSNMKGVKSKALPSFWCPALQPSAKAAKMAKPTRYMCPVTHDALTNVTPCAVLRTSGNIVTMDCVDEIIKKDWIDPTNGKPMTEADIIHLARGGTGFAQVNEEALDGKLARPAPIIA